MKASEKQEFTKKLATRLEKQFGRPAAGPDRTVLDTLLYAVCLENESFDSAQRAYASLQDDFHDLNEIRVSSISELAKAFAHQSEAEVRAHRVRTILQYVFEDVFAFDLEDIRKKTQDQAAKRLGEIRDLSAFIRNFVHQAALGAHLVPLDDRQTVVVTWLGLVAPESTPESAADQLKQAVRKADAPAFCHLLRRYATDPPAAERFDPLQFTVPEEGYSATDALRRVDEALGGQRRGSGRAKSRGVGKSKAAKKKAGKPAKTSRSAKAAGSKRPAKSAATKSSASKKKKAVKKAVKKSSGSKRVAGGKQRRRATSSK